MQVRAAEIKSGAFIVLAVIVLTVLLFAVGNLRERLRPKSTYYAYLPDAKFLKAHDAVTYGGIRVGEIQSVEVAFDPKHFGNVKVVITIGPEIEVREDSILVLKQDGMLGAKYLEISPGTQGAPLARPGSELRAQVIPAITDLSAAIKEPLEKIDKLLEGLNRILNSPENQKYISDILVNIKDLVVNLKEDLRRITDMVLRTGDSARALIDNMDRTVDELRPEIRSVLRSLEDLTTRLKGTVDNMNTLLRDADALLTQNSRNIYETIRALRDTAYHLEQAAKRIRANPSLVLFGGKESPEERKRRDETDLWLKGRTRRYDKEEK